MPLRNVDPPPPGCAERGPLERIARRNPLDYDPVSLKYLNELDRAEWENSSMRDDADE